MAIRYQKRVPYFLRELAPIVNQYYPGSGLELYALATVLEQLPPIKVDGRNGTHQLSTAIHTQTGMPCIKIRTTYQSLEILSRQMNTLKLALLQSQRTPEGLDLYVSILPKLFGFSRDYVASLSELYRSTDIGVALNIVSGRTSIPASVMTWEAMRCQDLGELARMMMKNPPNQRVQHLNAFQLYRIVHQNGIWKQLPIGTQRALLGVKHPEVLPSVLNRCTKSGAKKRLITGIG
jgi:hypothetical protein